MAPSRTRQSTVAGPSTERTPKKRANHSYPRKQRLLPNNDEALPGVQKLKSALRQTKRLLAKDNLGADVRVKTERRLKALEADLVRAERSRNERYNAAKYHKVKFFERQKIVRKINQTKRTIATSEGKAKKELQSALGNLRVDLNYVLHFPRTKKYVSLFPPEVRKSGPAVAPVVTSSDDNEERSRVREMIRQQMERGELSIEPEDELGKLGQEDKLLTSGRKGAEPAPRTKPRTDTDSVASDDFFGDDDEDDSRQGEASDA